MEIKNLLVQFGHQVVLNRLSFSVNSHHSFAILGTNASGKTALARVLTGEITPASGEVVEPPATCELVSLENQQALYERELYRDDTDLIDRIDEGTSVIQLLREVSEDEKKIHKVMELLELTTLSNRGYRLLSSGEGRRVMIARALLSEPQLLILDEPFEALDKTSRLSLRQALEKIIHSGQQVLLLINQKEDLLPAIHHLGILDQGELLFFGDTPENFQNAWQHLMSLREKPVQLPDRQSDYQLPDWSAQVPLITLTDGFVKYDETYQFSGLNWQLMPGEHTQIAGPNGCGKSTLLGLITGDHPQCYRNNLKLLGFVRGQGESIWEIKKHMGYVSSSLHRDYRAGGNALTAVVSGLTDSIGVYQSIGDAEKNLAMQWLQLIGLQHKWNTAFKSLSMGEQRLVLIARALIKQPPLLILDEPTQGLDDFNRFYVLSLVQKMVEGGPTTLLFVSHRQDETPGFIKRRLRFSSSKQDNQLFEIHQ